MIAAEGLLLVAVGVALGVPCAIAAGRLVRSFVYGLDAGDPLVLAGAGSALFLVAAWRAGFRPTVRRRSIR